MRYFMGPDVWAPTVQDIDAAGHERVESLAEAEVFVNTSSDSAAVPEGHPLYDLPNATMTPHIGASFQVAEHHMGAIFNANAAAWERGEPMPTRVDPDAGY